MSIHIVKSLSGVWSENSSSNDYSCLSQVVDKYGVYIFIDPTDSTVLYVGEAREQDLKTRVKQNFTENDTGGTFRKNYMEQEAKNFNGFKEFIREKNIVFFMLEKGMLIRALESMLIFTLKPKYNKDI